MPLTLTTVTDPTAEPLSLQEAKDHLRIDGEAEDAHLSALIVAAREWVEGFWGRTIVATKRKLSLDQFYTTGPARICDVGVYEGYRDYTIRLPGPPLIAVSSITYVDTDGTTQTLATSGYQVDAESEPARIVPAYGESWPTTRAQLNAVSITYTAGYAAPFTVAVDTNVLTVTARTYTDGDVVRLSNSGGELPTGLSANTDYYVRDVSGNTFKLAETSGGTAIDVTANSGSGTHFVGVIPAKAKQAMKLLIGHWWENREAVLTGSISKDIEFAVESLLWFDRIVSF